MAPITVTILDEEMSRAWLGLLLQHFSELEDDREPWRVMCPLKEVLLLVTCGTIASCAISTTLSSRASISSTSCGGSRSSITAFRASSGCASWSTGSTRLCSGAASSSGWRCCGPTGTSSLPLTRRRRPALTVIPRALRHCTRSQPTHIGTADPGAALCPRKYQ